MNNMLLDTIDSLTLRDPNELEKALTEQTATGIPWLNED